MKSKPTVPFVGRLNIPESSFRKLYSNSVFGYCELHRLPKSVCSVFNETIEK